MIYGYARVSTKEQKLNRQLDSLSKYVSNNDNIYTDKLSGKNMDRKSYHELKAKLIKGDEVYIHALDRLGRNKNAIKAEFIWFKEQGVILRVLNMPTTLIKLEGQAWVIEMINNIILEVLSSIAEQERVEMLQRQKEGIISARKRGVKFGRKEIDNNKLEKVQIMIDNGYSISKACTETGISRKTWYNYCNN